MKFLEATSVVDLGNFQLIVIRFGIAMTQFGIILVVMAFNMLGLHGMYFSDYFGFLFNKNIELIPFSKFENLQYRGR